MDNDQCMLVDMAPGHLYPKPSALTFCAIAPVGIHTHTYKEENLNVLEYLRKLLYQEMCGVMDDPA